MSGFLDGVLKPGQGAEMAVKREMQARIKKWTRTGYHYRGVGDFLLQHGVFWTGRELPDKYEALKGVPGTCYETSLAAAIADPSLRYCEGVYSLVGEDFKGHAWCIDQDGEVVELTQPTDPETVSKAHSRRTRLPFLPVERWGYFGCVFPAEYVTAHRERYYDEQGYCLFDLSAYEEGTQRELSGYARHSSVGWGDQDLDDDEEDDTDWDDDDEPELPSELRWQEHVFPTLKVPFDPQRTTLPDV